MNKKLPLYYIIATMGYGFVRKIPILYNAKVQTFDKDGKKFQVPMLFTTKATIAGISSVSSIYLWPIYVHNDLSKLEINCRRYKPEHYDYTYEKPKYAIDYVFL
jgi:hypothetical protein